MKSNAILGFLGALLAIPEREPRITAKRKVKAPDPKRRAKMKAARKQNRRTK